MPFTFHPITQTLIEQAAGQFRLPVSLVQAVVLQESGGRCDAFRFEPGFYTRYLKDKLEYSRWEPRRCSSSYGLMQVMFSTAVEMGFSGEPEELFQPARSLHYGCKYLRHLLDVFKGDTKMALAAYNGGIGGAHSQVPLAYANRVLERQKEFQTNE